MAPDDESDTPPAAAPGTPPELPDDRTVKQLLDAATRAELERWFGLPSFEQAAEAHAGAQVEDPQMAAARERRETALAAVDPGMLEAHRRRVEPPAWLLKDKPEIDLVLDPDRMAMIDLGSLERKASMIEPREVEISDEIVDDLRDCTPQALLRDLHRPELDFEKTFEIVDMAASQRIDVVAAVAEAMTTSWTLPAFDLTAFGEGRVLLDNLRAERRRPWTENLASLPNRRVAG